MLPEVRAADTCFYKVFGCSLFLKIKFSESVFPISGGDLKPKAPGLPPAGRFELALAQAAAFCWCPVGLLSHGHSPRGSRAHHTACCVTFPTKEPWNNALKCPTAWDSHRHPRTRQVASPGLLPPVPLFGWRFCVACAWGVQT